MTVDWFRVISNLTKHGMSHAQQAIEVGVERRTLDYWANRQHTEPPYSKGVILLEVHEIVTGSTAPQIRKDFSDK